MTEHAGFTQPRKTGDALIAELFAALADSDKHLTKYNTRRDGIIDELTALGAI